MSYLAIRHGPSIDCQGFAETVLHHFLRSRRARTDEACSRMKDPLATTELRLSSASVLERNDLSG